MCFLYFLPILICDISGFNLYYSAELSPLSRQNRPKICIVPVCRSIEKNVLLAL